MTQIPRKPTFPSYMVQKLRAKIQSDVQQDVIPVSTGIYSYEKLKNKLQAIPKPQIQNYQDKIFFEIIEDRLAVVDKTGQKCVSCDQEYNKKNPAIMCNFCAIWCCTNCMPLRKRPHPLSKDGSGKRYNVCQRCDTKYLNLQLGHSYVQNRTLLEQAIVNTSQELQSLMSQCQEYQEVLTKSKQTFEKNKFKISQLRKQKLELTKQIKNKMPEEIKMAEDKQEDLKAKFVDIHLKHKEWLELNEKKKQQRQEQQRQRKRQKEQQEQRKKQIEQDRRRRQQQEYQKRQRQRLQRQKIKKEQEQQEKKLRMRKAPSLQQNSTLSMNLTYSNSQSELEKKDDKQDQEKKTSERELMNKKNSRDYGGYESYRREESEQQEETRARQLSKTSLNNHQQLIPNNSNKQQQTISMHQSQFAQYFQHSQPQQASQTISYQNNDKLFHIQSNRIENFTFNDKQTLSNYENKYQSEWNLDMTKDETETDNKKQSINHQQYTFQKNQIDKWNEKEEQNKDEVQEIPISVSKPYKSEQQQEQNNKLSYIDQWYVNKNNSTNNNSHSTRNEQQTSNCYSYKQGQSSLSTALCSPTSTGVSNQSTNYSKKHKTQQQLEEQCTKSTSELDQQQLEVARYSLIKAARDSAVEQRQRNKIYQKSIYQTDTAPYDQEQAQGVGQIKKCQCSIY